MHTLARHLIVELYETDVGVNGDVDQVRAIMLEAARLIGATVVAEAFHRFEPQGVSGSVVIAESHLSVHTWPESGYVAIDILTCGGLDPRPALAQLVEAFSAGSARTQEIVRGLPDDVARGAALLPEDVQIMSTIAPLVISRGR